MTQDLRLLACIGPCEGQAVAQADGVISSVTQVDPGITSGAPCFAGTRVPMQALFDYLNGGRPLADFPADFPTVSEGQAPTETRERSPGMSKGGPEPMA